MATLNSSIPLMTFLLYSSSLLLLLFSYFPEKSQALESLFHTLNISSLLPASDCSRVDSTGFNTVQYSTTLEVVHRFGPCSPHDTQNKPSSAQILLYDQSRVDSIQARPKPGPDTNIIHELIHNQNKAKSKDKQANLPARSGVPLGSGNYVVTVGLGTPEQNVTLIFDTGSELTWTQCQPCVGYCYHQRSAMYNPSSSRTCSNISCNSSQCSKLGYDLNCYTGPCVYSIQYGDQSYSVGFANKDILTITPSDVFPDFVFGCGQKNRGLFGETDGLLGLSKDPHGVSIVSQTAKKYGKYFSYCLPSSQSSIGHLTFGENGANNSTKNVKFTPLIWNPFFYAIEIMAISVCGTNLPISQSVFKTAGTIIDSGTVITRLPPKAYIKMRLAFKKAMNKKYPSVPAFEILDTCYDFGNHTNITIPKISFAFRGGLKVDLDASGILYATNSTVACLAFAANSDPTDYGIFGNTQQKTFEVVYDVAGGRLGFRPNGCK